MLARRLLIILKDGTRIYYTAVTLIEGDAETIRICAERDDDYGMRTNADDTYIASHLIHLSIDFLGENQ